MMKSISSLSFTSSKRKLELVKLSALLIPNLKEKETFLFTFELVNEE